jgi:hypothetical protein
MKIYHSKEFVNVTIDKAKLLIQLQSLSDQELFEAFPVLAKTLDREKLIRTVVFGHE